MSVRLRLPFPSMPLTVALLMLLCVFACMCTSDNLIAFGDAAAGEAMRGHVYLGSARALPGMGCMEHYPPGVAACSDGHCNFTDPNNIFYNACDTDCVNQHGALYGVCLDTDICHCGPSVASSAKTPKPLQCLDPEYAAIYEAVCDEDCRCNHNTIGGWCNYWIKTCQCGRVNLGSELPRCPYTTANQFMIKLFERYTAMGFDPLAVLS